MNTMEKSAEVTAIEKKLDDILATLLRESQGSRCTLRIDDSVRNWNVDFICAEATRPGVKSLLGDGSIDQRAAATVQSPPAQKRNLLRPDLTGQPTPAP